MGENTTRLDKYAEAMDREARLWIGPMPDLRMAQVVMAVADAEQAELRAENERLTKERDEWRDADSGTLDLARRYWDRLRVAEDKLARVEALLNEWRTNADGLALSDVGPFDHTVNLATKGALFDCIDDLRTALDGTN